MRANRPDLFTAAVAALLLCGAGQFGSGPHVQNRISPDEFVRAVATHRISLIDLYIKEHLNLNARASHDDCPLVVAAALQNDWATVCRLLDAGASPDLADCGGVTALMAAAKQGRTDMVRELIGCVNSLESRDRSGHSALYYAIALGKMDTVNLLLSVMPVFEEATDDLLEAALANGGEEMIRIVAGRLPVMPEWTEGTRRALDAALQNDDTDLARLLLEKHATPPTPEGRNVPLLAYAILEDNASEFATLLECGADPNTALPRKYDKEFLAALPKSFRNNIEDDRDVTVLMLGAGIGRTDYVRALLQAGADRQRKTGRYKMLALNFAAELGHWQSTQLLLGSGPKPDHLRIEISLASQHVALIRDGVPVFDTICSTGRQGYSTRAGDYVITDKERNHRSTIYKVEMPYFMRLSCLDFGMHEGYVPNYPASHGCIRLPGEAARRLFADVPVGTLVTVK
jgi:ankyrin repeat protein